jgi:hypothetical protein
MSTGKILIPPTGRGIVLVVVTALVLTTSESPLVAAQAALDSKSISEIATDFSAVRRHRHYHRQGNAAGAAFMGLAIGMVSGAIAAQQRREYYEHYGYYYGPRYYYGPGYYYGGPYYYGPRYYYPPY